MMTGSTAFITQLAAAKERIAQLEAQLEASDRDTIAQVRRVQALEAALSGLLAAFETDEIDDFTAYEEPIPSAVHAARAALAPKEPI